MPILTHRAILAKIRKFLFLTRRSSRQRVSAVARLATGKTRPPTD
jgi:hypothetical protein